ncbi:unnamed protein product [Cercospora beticola]|nr:unnamed protein product [Cercospora beticola]
MASHDSDNGNNSCATLKLRQHLSKLPQELYDEVYNLTFTAEPKIRVYTKNRFWLAGLRRPAPRVFSDRDATFHEEFPPGFPVPRTDIFEQNTRLDDELPSILQADRADRNAFSLTFFGERDSDWEVSESAKTPMQALDRVLSFNELPHLLHVDRASRRKFAESFFGNEDSIFVFSDSFGFGGRRYGGEHTRLMRNIRLCVSDYHFSHYRSNTLAFAKDLEGFVFQCVTDCCVPILKEGIVGMVKERVGSIDDDGGE